MGYSYRALHQLDELSKFYSPQEACLIPFLSFALLDLAKEREAVLAALGPTWMEPEPITFMSNVP
jgi:hypothetical protein